MPKVNIRRVTKSDTDFILNLLPSLTDPELPHWRDPEVMLDIDQRILKAEIEEGNKDNAIFIAEDAQDNSRLLSDAKRRHRRARLHLRIDSQPLPRRTDLRGNWWRDHRTTAGNPI